MIILKAKDYSNRGELEKVVRNKVGLTPDVKPDYKIQGTKKELKTLSLSNAAIFWGIICEEVDDKDNVQPTKTTKQFEKINRGKASDFGINHNLKKIK